jgi:hypothetical protein
MNKLDMIKNRPGSPKKTIFLSQKNSGKRFDYLKTDKTKNTLIELNGRMVGRKYTEISSYSPARSVSATRDTNFFRSLKLFELPNSKRTLDFTLQPEPKQRQRTMTPMRKNSFDSNKSDYSLKSLIAGPEWKSGGGRKHCPLMYKSFTFDTLSKQLFCQNTDYRRMKKKSEFSDKVNDRFLPPKPTTKTKAINYKYAGWKNGLWDIPNKNNSNLYGNRSNISSAVSEVLGCYKYQKNNQIPVSYNINKYNAITDNNDSRNHGSGKKRFLNGK